ncbi:MAG: hypothetical protein EAZ67_04465 [Cytophagales bacterium]|nr:MAG: hypothetical protein EAZ67_04465 [Cytophagales bacterium]
MDSPIPNPESDMPDKKLPQEEGAKEELLPNSDETKTNNDMSKAIEMDSKQHIMHLLQRQNIPYALLGGLAAALLGAIIWAETTIILNDHKYAYMAVLIGLLVGFAVRMLGRGVEKRFGIIALTVVMLGCVLGNLFSVLAYVVEHFQISYWDTIMIFDFTFLVHLLEDRFAYPDVFFYAVALFVGYKVSFRELPIHTSLYTNPQV